MALKNMTINNMNKFYLLIVMGREMKLYRITHDNNQGHCFCEEEKIKSKIDME